MNHESDFYLRRHRRAHQPRPGRCQHDAPASPRLQDSVYRCSGAYGGKAGAPGGLRAENPAGLRPESEAQCPGNPTECPRRQVRAGCSQGMQADFQGVSARCHHRYRRLRQLSGAVCRILHENSRVCPREQRRSRCHYQAGFQAGRPGAGVLRGEQKDVPQPQQGGGGGNAGAPGVPLW